jgi:hypothetical protein
MPRSSDADLLMALLGRVLAATRAQLASEGAADARARLDAVRAAVDRLSPAARDVDAPSDPQRLAADLAALRGALVQAGAAARPDMAPLDQVLRTLMEWLENPSADAARDVDSLVAGLEKAFGAIGSPGAGEAAAQRDERLRAGAQAAISKRLQMAGIKPPDES